MESQKQSLVDVNELQSPMPDNMIRVVRKLKIQGSGIVWSGTSSTCARQLRHYPAFRRNEITIPVHSFVFVMAEGGGHFVGYLVDMYADKTGNKRAIVRWFHHNREVNGVIPNLECDPREIFMTHHVQAISVDCIEGFAIVLTPTHYEKCLAVVSLTVSTQVHVCCRQILNNKVKPFSVCALHGYTCQPILACIDWPYSIRTQLDNCEVKNPGTQIMKRESPAKKLKIKFTNGGKTSIELVSLNNAPGQRIEVLSQDSGMRGCWFRCKVLKASPKFLRVQYVDVLDADESTNLEECISACRMATPDNLGMRCSGRLTNRPYPPQDSYSEDTNYYEIGSAVDAWWCNGWWESFIVGRLDSRSVQVYCPGEKKILTVEIKDLRISRDWVDDKWVDILANKGILTCISTSGKTKTVSNKLEAVDENVAVADLLKPLRIGDGDNTQVDTRGDSSAGTWDYLELS